MWSTNAINEFKRYISESAKLKYIPLKRVDCQYFGRLIATTYEGVDVDINDILIKLDMAIQCKDSFDMTIKKLNTIKIKRYENNSGHILFHDLKQNEINVKYSQMVNRDEKMQPSVKVTRKVSAWDQRNRKFKIDMQKEVTEPVNDCWVDDQQNCEFQINMRKEVAEPVSDYCDDDMFFDSVSGYNSNHSFMLKNDQCKTMMAENTSSILVQSGLVENVTSPEETCVKKRSLGISYFRKLYLEKQNKMVKDRLVPKELSNLQVNDQVADSDDFVKHTVSVNSRIKKDSQKEVDHYFVPAGFDQGRIRKDLVPTSRSRAQNTI